MTLREHKADCGIWCGGESVCTCGLSRPWSKEHSEALIALEGDAHVSAGGELPAPDDRAALEHLIKIGPHSDATKADAANIVTAILWWLDEHGWRSIGSAPKDGSHILVTVLGGGGFGWCGGKHQDWCAVVHYWPVEGEAGFYLSTGASGHDDRPMQFTHWMPLPKSPLEGK